MGQFLVDYKSMIIDESILLMILHIDMAVPWKTTALLVTTMLNVIFLILDPKYSIRGIVQDFWAKPGILAHCIS